jgi:ketosteroid isomerase-like protein
MWSRNDPVTLFGAALSGNGWAEIGPVFERLGSSFSDGTSYRNEIIAAGASGDLAYTVALEHTTASVKGAPAQPYVLRATTVFRREDGEWKVVHRHADPASPSATVVAEQLASPAATRHRPAPPTANTSG